MTVDRDDLRMLAVQADRALEVFSLDDEAKAEAAAEAVLERPPHIRCGGDDKIEPFPETDMHGWGGNPAGS